MTRITQINRKINEREILDSPDECTRAEIIRNLDDIAAANRWFGGIYAITNHLFKFIGSHPANQPVHILDIATGSADIPINIVQWARKHNIHVSITALDINPVIVEAAKTRAKLYPEICIEQQDIRSLHYPASSFDYVICSQLIHHLETENVLAVIKAASIITSQGIIISDFIRSTACIFLAKIFSAFMTNRLSKHDARISFENAFTPSEMKLLAEEAGLPRYRVYIHRPCRMVLVADKRNTVSEKGIWYKHTPSPIKS